MKVREIETYRNLDHGLSYATGVCDINPWAMRAMMRPHSHTGPTFWKLYNETIEMMKSFLHTKATIVPIVGPGRVTLDALVNNFIEPGDRMLALENGYWGNYFDVMKTYNIDLTRLTGSGNRPIDPEAVEKKLKEDNNFKLINIAHTETENGMLNPVRQIGEVVKRLAPDAIYAVDSATAFPGNPIDVDGWGIDVCYFVSHKGFNGPSGLNFMSVNDKAMDAFNKRSTLPQSWYTSIQTWKDIWLENVNDGRHCLTSFPNIIVPAVRAKLDLMNQMGEAKYLKKYELASRAIRMGLRKMTEPEDKLMIGGPKCEGCPGCEFPDMNAAPDGKGRFCAQTDAAIAYPKGIDYKSVMKNMEERYWINCPHFGFGDEREGGYFYSSNGMRVGTVNDRHHYPRNILAVITGLAFCFKEAGIEGINIEKGISATNEVLKEMQATLDWPYID